MPWQKPAQAAEMSNAAAWLVPSSWAIAVATAGVWSMWLTVATITQSICSGATPALSSASREASTLIIWMVSSGAAQRRVLMPERCWIHSSLESIASTTSAFGMRRAVGADAEDGGVEPGVADRGHQSSSETEKGLAGDTGRRLTSHSTTAPWGATLVCPRRWDLADGAGSRSAPAPRRGGRCRRGDTVRGRRVAGAAVLARTRGRRRAGRAS